MIPKYFFINNYFDYKNAWIPNDNNRLYNSVWINALNHKYAKMISPWLIMNLRLIHPNILPFEMAKLLID